MAGHVFEITFDTPSPHTGRVKMDGLELGGIISVDVGAHVNGGPVELTLRFIPEKVLLRIVDPKVALAFSALKAEVTAIGDKDKRYVTADPVVRD